MLLVLTSHVACLLMAGRTYLDPGRGSGLRASIRSGALLAAMRVLQSCLVKGTILTPAQQRRIQPWSTPLEYSGVQDRPRPMMGIYLAFHSRALGRW
jgi:hypothetical protein